jgi:hypothetical protein
VSDANVSRYSRLRRALNFVSHGFYINPARIAPDLLTKIAGRIGIAKTCQPAVLITTGAVSSCNLVQPVSGSYNQTSYRVRNISIYPFTQEHERTISCVGNVFGQQILYGPIVSGAMTFSTRREGSGFTCESVCFSC